MDIFSTFKFVVLRNWFFFYNPTPALISVFSNHLYVIFSHKILPFNFFQLVYDLFFSYFKDFSYQGKRSINYLSTIQYWNSYIEN